MAHDSAPGGLSHQQRDTPSRVDEITDRLITAIAIGEYLPGARLPVERDLAASLRAGRNRSSAAGGISILIGRTSSWYGNSLLPPGSPPNLMTYPASLVI